VLAWTPAERRGVMVVALLLAIGTVYDLARGRGRTPPPRDVPATVTVTVAPPPAGAAGALPDSQATPAARAGAARVDLNQATTSELDALPGIGPVLAGRIVSHRVEHGPYRAVDDLLDVPGIGPTLLERLRPRVSAGR